MEKIKFEKLMPKGYAHKNWTIIPREHGARCWKVYYGDSRLNHGPVIRTPSLKDAKNFVFMCELAKENSNRVEVDNNGRTIKCTYYF